jgi:hypothetical protein
MKRAHQAGGRSVPTWQKGKYDKYVNLLGAFLVVDGLFHLIPGYWNLATGKGKME